MNPGYIRTLRFTRAWSTTRAECDEDEVELVTSSGPGAATRFRSPGRGPGPSWILLHGMTRTGRRHPSLARFARSVAGSGATVLIPEVPEWIDLQLAPDRTRNAVLSAVDFIESDPGTRGPPGLMGFSFGGPQVLRVSAAPELEGRLACVASFGGYGDMERTVRFLMTGMHEWEGTEHRVRPDPYGRWIVAANYLTRVPGYEEAGAVSDGLRTIAVHAGDQAIESWDPRLDSLKDGIADTLPERWVDLFRFFAPPAASEPVPPSEQSARWARELTRAGVGQCPELGVPEVLEIPFPTYLVHGRNDHLIPYTEVFRLAERIRSPRLEVSVTRLFGHSAGDAPPRGVREWSREVWRLGRTLSHLFGEP